MTGGLFDAPVDQKSRPCERQLTRGGHRCRIGGGDACYSDDGGRTWFCRPHAPVDFLPKNGGQR